ncbi:MAG: zf-HC2 domain-containing protein [Candidatus Latescibacteria bacterium]|nr:zf-HC2 domain-containing protein [Candidatus Latescibacterota bacterium]
MTCSHVQRQMTLYLERACPADEIAAIAYHIESCPACAGAVADVQRVKTLLQAVRIPPLDPSLQSAMMTAIREQRARTRMIRLSAHRAWLGDRLTVFHRPLYAISAAAAVVIAGATVVWYLLTSQPTTLTQGMREGEEMRFYLKEHALVADQNVFSNGAFGSVLVSNVKKK